MAQKYGNTLTFPSDVQNLLINSIVMTNEIYLEVNKFWLEEFSFLL